jgi:hypothetical protein
MRAPDPTVTSEPAGGMPFAAAMSILSSPGLEVIEIGLEKRSACVFDQASGLFLPGASAWPPTAI